MIDKSESQNLQTGTDLSLKSKIQIRTQKNAELKEMRETMMSNWGTA